MLKHKKLITLISIATVIAVSLSLWLPYRVSIKTDEGIVSISVSQSVAYANPSVAFDAVAIPALALYTATFSWTHTPVGTPKGVAVIVVQEGSIDQVSVVTYGGVAMTRVRSDVRTATEPGRVYIYFLGSSVPTGAQTVQVFLTGTEDTNAVSLTVTAAADTAVDVSNGLDAGIIANPSLSISPTVAAVIFYGIFSGLAAPVTTVQAGSTHVAGKDYGTDSAMWARKSVSAGATTIGYTAASDDVCHSALAIKEEAAAPSITVSPTTCNFTSVTEGSTPSTNTTAFFIDNTSTIQTDQTIRANTASWSGGWTHSDNATAGNNTVGLLANKGGTWGVGDVIVKYNATWNYIAENQAANTDYYFGLKLIAPTTFTNGSVQSCNVTITAVAG